MADILDQVQEQSEGIFLKFRVCVCELLLLLSVCENLCLPYISAPHLFGFEFVQIRRGFARPAVMYAGRLSDNEIQRNSRFDVTENRPLTCVRFWQFQSGIVCYWNQLSDPLSHFWFDPHSRAVLWTCLSVSLSRWSLGRRDVGHRDLYPAGLALRFDWGHTTSPDPPHRRRRAGASREYHLILK